MIVQQLLSTFNHPEWNLIYVREILSFSGLLDRLKENFEKVQNEAGCPDMTIFSSIATKLQFMKDYLEGKLTEDYRSTGLEPRDNRELDMANTGDFMDFLDEAWMKDIFGPWDFQSSLGVAFEGVGDGEGNINGVPDPSFN